MWCTETIQIRTHILFRESVLYIVKSDCLCAVLVVEGDNHLIVKEIDCIDKSINQHLAVGLLSHIQLAEAVQPKGHELSADFWFHQLLVGNADF